MKIEIVYPTEDVKSIKKLEVLSKIKWIFLFTAYICPVINILTGGKAWSVIVLWSLWIIFTFILSPDLVEYNRISQFVKFISNTSVLLIIVDVFIVSGWAVKVVPIFGFAGIVVSGILFFTDFNTQKQNLMPLLKLIFISLVCSVIGLVVWRNESHWALIVMGALALALLLASIKVLGEDFTREIHKRFHIR